MLILIYKRTFNILTWGIKGWRRLLEVSERFHFVQLNDVLLLCAAAFITELRQGSVLEPVLFIVHILSSRKQEMNFQRYADDSQQLVKPQSLPIISDFVFSQTQAVVIDPRHPLDESV